MTVPSLAQEKILAEIVAYPDPEPGRDLERVP